MNRLEPGHYSAHASPRYHMRRGHIRRLPTGKTTFVHAHFVGSQDTGTVDKNYRFKEKTG